MKITTGILINYLATALWASIDESGKPMSESFTLSDFSGESTIQAIKDLETFFALVGDVKNIYNLETMSHDFWLTRNGHGAGFRDGDYDRDEHEDGEFLTAVAKSFKELHLEADSDGKLRFL